jgi:protein-L-isoaspartate(D-aspartate) O-methyltransferase
MKEAPQYDDLRSEMVARQLRDRGICDERVLTAMQKVPRHLFVPAEFKGRAYQDRPLPLGPDQTISQPYIVAYMLEALELQSHERVLEVGAGSGYQAALLAELTKEVFALDIETRLIAAAERVVCDELKYSNVRFRCSNGFEGWPEEAPFDAIIVAAAPSYVPRELVRELGPGGRLILPLGTDRQCLVLFENTASGLTSRELCAVRFVEMKE